MASVTSIARVFEGERNFFSCDAGKTSLELVDFIKLLQNPHNLLPGQIFAEKDVRVVTDSADVVFTAEEIKVILLAAQHFSQEGVGDPLAENGFLPPLPSPPIFFNDGTYSGSILCNMPHGKGEMVYSYGPYAIYNGDWKDGVFHGSGVLTFNDGKIAKGCWVEGCLSDGIISYPNCRNKAVCQGMFDEDYLLYGKGKKTWTTTKGETKHYVGDFQKGQMHGDGALTTKNIQGLVSSSVYCGGFKENKTHGSGTLTIHYLNGKKIVSQNIFKNGDLKIHAEGGLLFFILQKFRSAISS
jgi:hypothetical protein